MAKKKLPGLFRILRGNHTVKVKTGVNEAGLPIHRLDQYRADGEGKGNVVESDIDLEERFNGVGNRKRKFEYIGPAGSNGSTPQTQDQETDDGNLSSLSVEELRAVAKEEEIDLTGLSRKADIVAQINEHRASLQSSDTE